MKKTDIALIIIIVSISAGLSYWVANMTLGEANEKPITVRTAEEIQVGDTQVAVDESVFSKDGINPTVEINISGEDLTSFIEAGDSGAPAADGINAEENTIDTPVDGS